MKEYYHHHIVGCSGLSMAVVNTEDTRPLYDGSSSTTESSSVAVVSEVRKECYHHHTAGCFGLSMTVFNAEDARPLQQQTATQQHQPLQQDAKAEV
jgi:hypothetical protein